MTAEKKLICECWLSLNSGPNGECENCGLVPDLKARAKEQAEAKENMDLDIPMRGGDLGGNTRR